MEGVHTSVPSQTESFHSSPGGPFTVEGAAADGEQRYSLDISTIELPYRDAEDAYYSPSADSYSSTSPTSPDLLTGPLDSLDDDELSRYLQGLESIFDQNPSNPSSNLIPFQDPFLFSDHFPQSFSSERRLPQPDPDYFSTDSIRQFSSSQGREIPIQDTSDSSYIPFNSASNSADNDISRLQGHHPLSAPLHNDYPTPHRFPRTRSEPSSGLERPTTLFPRDPQALPDVFYPDDSPTSSTQPVIEMDKFWDKYTLDSVPVGLLSLGPSHRVPKQGFLSLPRTTHGRTKSEGRVMDFGNHETYSQPNPAADIMSRQRLSSQRSAPALRNAFEEGHSSSEKIHNVSHQSLVLQLISDTGGDHSSAPSSSSAGGFEDESESQSVSSKFPDDLSSAEDPPTPTSTSSSSRIVKRNVTTPATRLASDARMRTQARFSCDICSQCLTTKGGLRNHRNSHLGIKRYKCSEPNCRKPFTTKWVCTRHERTVHGLLV